jgi:alkylation response protein AidB-like acyl-CoA dehydrogenase
MADLLPSDPPATTPATPAPAPAGVTPPPPLLGALLAPQSWTPTEAELLARLAELADGELAGLSAGNDSTGRYPTASIAALRAAGLTSVSVPAKLGGAGVSHRFALEAQVRLAAVDSAVAQIWKVHDELVREILVYCPDVLRPRLAAEILDGRMLGLAVAETGRTAADPWTTVVTTADDGSRVVSGTKIYTTGAAEADYVATWGFDPVAGQDNPFLGFSLTLVPAGTAGMTVHRDWDTLGQRATDSGAITFDEVRVEPGLIASQPGLAPLPQSPLRYQAGFAAVLLGIGFGALRAAAGFVAGASRPWVNAGVERAVDDPMIRRLAGELAADLAAAYTLTMTTGDLLDAFERGDIDRTALAIPIYAAKSAASRAAVRATSEILALAGTRSTARSHAFDRWWRDARTVSLHDPVDWKHAEIGQYLLTGEAPAPGVYT